jgi:hypothetical protein
VSSESLKEGSSWVAPIMIGALVIVLWLANYFLLVDDVSNRGTVGDMFGAVNALFSGLAFVGVVYAILLQRKELKLQREELALTREELKGQRKEFEEQNKTLKKQRFENTFFQMLSLHNEIINSMNIPQGDGDELRGRAIFKSIISRFQSRTIPSIENEKGANISSHDLVVEAYFSIYELNQSFLGHYFRGLYRIFKFVDESDIENKKFYTDIVRAQLSNQELQLLFYNCLTTLGSKKFKPLIERYAIFNNLPEKLIYDGITLKSLYDDGAYGEL